MLWFNRFMVMKIGVGGRGLSFLFCFRSLFPLRCALGSVNPHLANLKQDMELVSRIGWIEDGSRACSRENANFGSPSSNLPPPKLCIRNELKSYPTSGYPFAGVERRALQGEKEQIASKISTNNSRISCRDEQGDFLVSQSSSSASSSSPKTFPRLPQTGSYTKSKKAKRSAVLP